MRTSSHSQPNNTNITVSCRQQYRRRQQQQQQQQQHLWVGGLTLRVLLFCQFLSHTHGWSPLRVAASRRVSFSTGMAERPCTVGKTKRIPHALRKIGPSFSFISTTLSSQPPSAEESDLLKSENSILRDIVRQLEEENQRLKQRAQRMVGLENFEGERFFRDNTDAMPLASSMMDMGGITMSGEESSQDEMWCDELDDDQCPIEPTISFGEALRDRAYWLVGLLLLQSFSGIILSQNEALLSDHPVIIFFLTMLVGAGGNAGNQASVRVIRGLALGTLNDKTRGQFLAREFKMAAALSVILSITGFFRAIVFGTALLETVAITSALTMIVFISVCLGAILPLVLERMGVDPAHSSTTIQVIMDILGVILAVTVSRTILDGPLGAFLISKLGGA